MEADIVPLPRKQDWSARIGIKAFRYKGLITRFWWIPLLTVSAGLAWQGWILFRTPVLYASQGTLMVTEPIDLQDNTAAREESDEFFGTQIAIMSNQEVATRARQQVAIEAPDLKPCDVQITPTQVLRTSLFNVIGVGANAEYVQRYVDAVMQQTIKFKSDKLLEGKRQRREQLQPGTGAPGRRP